MYVYRFLCKSAPEGLHVTFDYPPLCYVPRNVSSESMG